MSVRRIGCIRPAKRLTIACKLCHDPAKPVVRFNLNVAGKDRDSGRWTTKAMGSTVLCADCLRILTLGVARRRAAA